MVGVFDENQLHRYDQTLLEIELVLTNLGKMIEYVFFDFFPSPIFWGKTKEGHLEPKEHAIKFLNRFIDSAELIKENTGVDILEDRPDNDKKTKDYKSLLRKYAEKRKTSKGK
jgi:hypothetical protein